MKKQVLVFIILLAASVMACQLMRGSPTQAPAPTYTPYPTYTPPPLPTETLVPTEPPTEAPIEPEYSAPVLATRDPDAQGEYYVHLVNNLFHNVCKVYINPAGSQEVGEERLKFTSKTILFSGQEVVIYHSVEEFSIWIFDCNSELLKWRNEVVAESDGMLWVLNPSKPKEDGSIEPDYFLNKNDRFVRIVNELDAEICELYISPIASERWGENLLNENTVPPDDNRVVFHSYEEFDIQVRDCDGGIMDEQFGIFLPSEGLNWKVNP